MAQWQSYQDARQTVIELMNEAEKKLTEFSTAKAATSQEAEDRLRTHRVLTATGSMFPVELLLIKTWTFIIVTVLVHYSWSTPSSLLQYQVSLM